MEHGAWSKGHGAWSKGQRGKSKGHGALAQLADMRAKGLAACQA
jgi:hypothetical protein